MAEELGKIEKPEADSYQNKKKLFLVPLVYASKESPPEYMELYELYWSQVSEHLKNLEAKIGIINRIYHESLSIAGEDGLKILKEMNDKSHHLVEEKSRGGSMVELVEDKALVEESVDWERCLLIGLISETVARKVYDFYMETAKKRYEYINKRIAETLKPGEAALLLIRENHMVQFQPDIDVFHVSPPALNDIHRWLRNRKPVYDNEKKSDNSEEDKAE